MNQFATAFNPRGTSGSGKTTIVRAVMEEARVVPFIHHHKKTRVYNGTLFGCDLFVLGDYTKVCGGCDTIQPFAEIIPIMNDLMMGDQPTIIVYEGLLISHSIGSIGQFVKPMGRRHIMGFIDTPILTCLDRVKKRRLERGQLAPLNPQNTMKDHGSVARCAFRAVNEGFRVEIIPHKDAIAHSMRLLDGLSELAKAGKVDSGAGVNP